MSRRFSLGRALASENWNEEEYPNQISAEEADVMNQEAIELADEIQAENAEVDRMVDVSDSLEDMAVVADQIVEPTEGEVAMAQIAGDMATAGDDELTGDDVVEVAAESGGVRRIAAESLREKASQVWEQIKKWLKEVWKKVEQFFYKIFGNIPSLRKEVEAMRKRADQVDEDGKIQKSENAKMELTNGLDSLKVGQAVTTKWSETLAGFEKSLTAAKTFAKANELAGFGKTLAEAIDKFEADKGAGTDGKGAPIEGVVDAIYKQNSKELKVHVLGNDGKDIDGLLGGRKLVEKFTLTASTPSNAEKLAAFRGFKVRFETDGDKGVKKDSVNYTALTTTEVLAACDKADEMLDLLEEFHRGKAKKDMSKYASEIEKACTKVSKAADSISNDDAATKATLVADAKAVYRLSTTYAQVCSTVTTQLYAHSLANVRTLLMLCAKSLSTYTKD